MRGGGFCISALLWVHFYLVAVVVMLRHPWFRFAVDVDLRAGQSVQGMSSVIATICKLSGDDCFADTIRHMLDLTLLLMLQAYCAQTSCPTPSTQLPSLSTPASHSLNLPLIPSIPVRSSTFGCTHVIRATSAT